MTKDNEKFHEKQTKLQPYWVLPSILWMISQEHYI